MPNFLLIETSTDVCSVAIATADQVLSLQENLQTQQHAALLTNQIDACVRESGLALRDLDAVAVSHGPGSYTSLRVGVSTAKGICYALQKPLIAVDTLQALALASMPLPPANQNVLLIPMLDARRQEVWTAIYDASLQEIMPAQPLILENNLFESEWLEIPAYKNCEKIVFSGNGGMKAKNVTFAKETVWSDVRLCSAGGLLPLANQIFQKRDFQDIAYFEPVYMKPPNITISNKVF